MPITCMKGKSFCFNEEGINLYGSEMIKGDYRKYKLVKMKIDKCVPTTEKVCASETDI